MIKQRYQDNNSNKDSQWVKLQDEHVLTNC